MSEKTVVSSENASISSISKTHDDSASTVRQGDGPTTSYAGREKHLVQFKTADDPLKAINWPLKRKILTVLLFGCTTMGSTIATSTYSSGTRGIAQDFSIDSDVASLGTSLILVGFGTGPLLWAPLSELYGRKLPTVVPYFIATCFIFATASGKDVQTLMIARFMAGFFGSAPLAITGGVLADLFTIEHRAIALTGYALAVIGGPALGMCNLSIAADFMVNLFLLC